MNLQSGTGRRLTPSEAESLWRAWSTRQDAEARNQLILSYAPMVHYLASRKARSIPAHCEVDDLVSCGLMGLVAAVDRFDPTRGATFEQFAWTRVNGAIVDELRRLDWAPRSVRRAERETEQARESFQAREGRPPSEAELADKLSVTVDELRERATDVERAAVMSLSQKVSGNDATIAEIGDAIEAPELGTNPEQAMLARERAETLRAAIKALPERELQVLASVHVHQIPGAEIGRMLGVSESRVSQILASARRRLQLAMSQYDRSTGVAA
jgi:RNA polymerase sigma factor for flagellar operon FliA